MKFFKSKKFLITLAVLISILIVAFLVFLFSDEDFAPYIQNHDTISVSIKGNVFVPSEVEDELSDIADKYLDNPKFVYAEYNFTEKDNTALFRFFDGKDGDRYCAYLDISVNLQNNTAYKTDYEYGISKRLGQATAPIKYKTKNAYDVYQDYIKDYQNKNKVVGCSSIKYDAATLITVFYNKDNYVIDSFVVESLYD